MRRALFLISLLVLIFALAACDGGCQYAQSGGRPDNAIDISIIYAPESEQYMPQVIADFNRISAEGRNPVTGQP